MGVRRTSRFNSLTEIVKLCFQLFTLPRVEAIARNIQLLGGTYVFTSSLPQLQQDHLVWLR